MRCNWLLNLSHNFSRAALGIAISLLCESAHFHNPDNPHSDRRERNEQELRAELRVRGRQCRATGQSHFDFILVERDFA